ncbi:MAG: pseudouridylate synthase [Prevotellaceae bacterium]|jgi:predicted hotdog family 3-hydroxylacyl-ACP dehydratase|nr:pseudouridylate synthase [Prevotellaceae bacterium]
MIETIDIKELLPQKGAFVMLDRLTEVDEHKAVSRLKVRSDNLFVENNLFEAAGLVENIAQTAAAKIGYTAKYINKSEITIGFIGEVKNLVIKHLPCVGDELKTTVAFVGEALSTLLVNAIVEIGEQTVASCKMKVFMTDIQSTN